MIRNASIDLIKIIRACVFFILASTAHANEWIGTSRPEPLRKFLQLELTSTFPKGLGVAFSYPWRDFEFGCEASFFLIPTVSLLQHWISTDTTLFARIPLGDSRFALKVALGHKTTAFGLSLPAKYESDGETNPSYGYFSMSSWPIEVGFEIHYYLAKNLTAYSAIGVIIPILYSGTSRTYAKGIDGLGEETNSIAMGRLAGLPIPLIRFIGIRF